MGLSILGGIANADGCGARPVLEGPVWACGEERQAGWSRQWPQRFRLGRPKGSEERGTRDLGSCASIFTRFDSSRAAATRVSTWPGTRRFQEKPTKVLFNTFEGWLSLRGCPFEGRLNSEKKNIIFEIG